MMKLLNTVALATPAFAGNWQCDSAEKTKVQAAEQGLKWIELTRDQWQLGRGMSVVLRKTSLGLPPHDKVALLRFRGPQGLVSETPVMPLVSGASA